MSDGGVELGLLGVMLGEPCAVHPNAKNRRAATPRMAASVVYLIQAP